MEKYYTPKLEEFCIGFEYEIFEDYDKPNEKSWHKLAWERYNLNPENIGWPLPPKEGKIRVKYLDSIDIESFGFFSTECSSDTYYQNGDYCIITEDFKPNLGLRLDIGFAGMSEDTPHFLGYVKNKSELKRILKQLNII